MDIERKEFPFVMEDKGLDPEARTFKGFAAVTGNLDDGGDIIERGAFKKTIAEMGERIKIYWIHDFQQPIGRVLELGELPKSKLPSGLLERAPNATGGLHVKGYISRTSLGEDALTLMRDKVLDELSIGFKSTKEDFKDDGPEGQTVRHLQELKLVDISPVPLAMNPAAIVTDVKGFKVEETEDYVHVPVPGEEGKHKGHRIRTIQISEEQGIQARYCGECKKNISYLFAKDKGWTVKKAVAWVKEHSKMEDIEDIEVKESVPASFFSDFAADLADDPMTDVNAIHRRFHNWAGQGIVIEGLTAAQMAKLHNIIAKELTKRCKEEGGTDCAHDSPLSASDFSKSFSEFETKCRAWNRFMGRLSKLLGKAQEPPLGALPATQKASREARLRLEKAKQYMEVLNRGKATK